MGWAGFGAWVLRQAPGAFTGVAALRPAARLVARRTRVAV
jgi:hypothetical protein